ncbi:MAG: transporter substrate-binding protein, partial [Dehalococcoidia bacterium]
MLVACSSDSDSSGSGSSGSGSGDTIKVGVLHSLSGTMAVSEVSVKDAELLAIEEINAAGGVLGKQLEPIIEDGASDWPTFAEKAKKLIQQDKVAVTFCCWTSASRKAVLPVFEANKSLAWYPVQYEGLESSPYIYYMGATTNQQIVPSVEYLLKEGKSKFFLLGSDYVFPRTANKIIKAQLEASGGQTVAEEYTPLGHTDYTTVINKIKSANPDVIYNTLNGDSNVAFFKQLQDAGISPDKITTMSV